MSYLRRITRYTVVPENDKSILSEQFTHIEIEDEGAGEFVKLRQCNGGAKDQSIAINFGAEWAAIRSAVDLLAAQQKEAGDE